MSYWISRSWWTATGERAAKTAAQALLAIIGVDQVGLMDINWVAALSLVGTATVLSFLSSIVSTPVGPEDSPSLV